MDRLIKLLNEYKTYTDHKKSRMSEYVWANVGDDIVMSSYVGTTKDKTLEIISEKFGFIDWLVENEKIDRDKVKLLSVFQETWYYNLYQSLLMILAIQENPIEFLCSVLK